jgi:hypothetical protein
MSESPAYVSKDGTGHIKLEYKQNGRQMVKLWEARGTGILETTFDDDGQVLLQKLIKSGGNELDQLVISSLKEANVSETRETAYTNVKFGKPCPKCGKQDLLRYAEAFSTQSEIPVIPMYYCKNCSTKSYHLTNDYLEYLVENNAALFEEAELSEMKSDKKAFMTEIRGYIIRIFASKKIMCIE